MSEMDPKDIARHELVGLHVRIADSADNGMIGICGRVIDETRNTLVIERHDGSAVTAIKEGSVFSFEYKKDRRVRIDGRLLVARPEDRIKKKLKRW